MSQWTDDYVSSIKVSIPFIIGKRVIFYEIVVSNKTHPVGCQAPWPFHWSAGVSHTCLLMRAC